LNYIGTRSGAAYPVAVWEPIVYHNKLIDTSKRWSRLKVRNFELSTIKLLVPFQCPFQGIGVYQSALLVFIH